jgi:uncharacterized DUF497 family protein
LRALPVSGTIAYVQYEWDNGKAAEKLRKHGVDFADAIAALEDANRLEENRRAVRVQRGANSSHRNGSRQRPVRDRYTA